MKIGEVIRKYRKEMQMTQEEMANRLGVTTPAVNKWENGVSLPDVSMLVPIARLLKISVDTLLSYRENLSDEEVREKINALWIQLNGGQHEAALQQMQQTVKEYPNCHSLMLWTAQALDAYYTVMPEHKTIEAEQFVESCCLRALESDEEVVRIGAADALFHKAIREEAYDRAESYLRCFSVENPERKRKQALLFGKTGRVDEACQAYEEILYAGCQTARMVLQSLYTIAKEQGDFAQAAFLAEKHCALVRVYDMGDYAEAATLLELGMDTKDAELTLSALERVLDGVDTLHAPSISPLYAHMQFHSNRSDYGEQLRCRLKQEFRTDERFEFLYEHQRFQNLIK